MNSVEQKINQCLYVLKANGKIKINKHTGSPFIKNSCLHFRAPVEVYQEAAAKYFVFENINEIVVEKDDKNKIISANNIHENESIVYARLKQRLLDPNVYQVILFDKKGYPMDYFLSLY
jgi:hypothetical protein